MSGTDAQSERLSAALADRYTIEREIGAGGMATVYLAHDVRHDRKVALKVLREELGAVLGVERFLAEIRVTANLQHPNLLPLFDSGEADGLLFYVMPFIQGETLRTQLERETVLPVDEAVRIASVIARALDYAHRQNVVHRDLKPENVLMHEGQPVIADFGIALAVSNAGGARLTQTGMSIGTPHYMSPEQATGEKAIDRRSDIYALAAVTYEMLAGEPPHTGPTAAAVIARVLVDPPRSLRSVRDTVPEHVEQAVARGLAKLPADRWTTASDFADALTNADVARRAPPTVAVYGAGGGAAAADRHVARAFKRRFLAASVVAAAALVAAAWGWSRGAAPELRPIVKVILGPAPGVGLPTAVLGASIAISPDGSKIAFAGTDSAGQGHLYLRYLDRVQPVVVADTAGQPFFSPDGGSLGFSQGRKLRTVVLGGGTAVTVCDSVAYRGATWGDDGTIVFGGGRGLMRVPATGGTPEVLLANPPHGTYVYPTFLPGARSILFGITGDSGGGAVLTVADRSFKRLGLPGINVQFADPGLLVFGRIDGTVAVVAFDVRRLRLTGRPEMLTDQVLVRLDGTARFALAQSGVLAHFVSSDEAYRDLVLVDRRGQVTALGVPRRLFARPRFAPDGRRIAFGTSRVTAGGSDVWVFSMDARLVQRLTTDSVSGEPEWDPDGRGIVFQGSDFQLRVPSDGSGAPVPVPGRAAKALEFHLMPDGRTAVFRATGADGKSQLLMAPLDSTSEATTLQPSNGHERSIAVSPDGRWLAYVSDETGNREVYVRRLQAASGRWRVSPNGGSEPRFARGGELFFRARDTVFVSRVDPGAEPRIGAAKALFGGVFNTSVSDADWDVSPDGTRFVMVRNVVGAAGGRIGLYLNWTDRWRGRQR